MSYGGNQCTCLFKVSGDLAAVGRNGVWQSLDTLSITGYMGTSWQIPIGKNHQVVNLDRREDASNALKNFFFFAITTKVFDCFKNVDFLLSVILI